MNVMNVPGTGSKISGKGNKNLPYNVRATVEWEGAEAQEAGE